MKRELSIVISSLIISWQVEMIKPKTQFILLILDWLNATRAQMESIFLSEMERTLPELPDMLVSIPIWVTSNQEGMILRQLDMSFCTFWKDHFLGKDFPADLKPRNMPTLRRKRKKPQLRSSVKTNLKNSKNSCTTVEAWASPKILTTVTSLDYLKVAWRDTDMTPKTLTSSGTKTDWP